MSSTSSSRRVLPGAEQIANEIRQMIHERGLQPGDRLGRAEELAQMFGVSRPTLREALRGLSTMHLVRSTQGPGGGVFVASTAQQSMTRSVSDAVAHLMRADGTSLVQLMEARVALEVPIAGWAAERATDEDVAALEAILQTSEAELEDALAFADADTSFHRRLAAASGNPVLRAMSDWAFELLQPALVDLVMHDITPADVLKQHRAILRAVRRRNRTASERAMHRHLDYLHQVVLSVTQPDATEN